MKVVILAGGLGSRLSEETVDRPKPMVKIGGIPILEHVMRIYERFGLTDFVVCLGYKGVMIRDHFANSSMPASFSLIDTGGSSATGGRLKRVGRFLKETFCLTYSDGLADIDIKALIEFHHQHERLATVTAVTAPLRFGALDLDGDRVRSFTEKPPILVSGGFLVMEPAALDRIDGDDTRLEDVLTGLAADGELAAYRHTGFWHPMDTLRDKQHLEALWASGNAPW